MDDLDYHARSQVLENAEAERFWKILRMSVVDAIFEKQKEVNDLATQGDDLFRCRVELKCLQELANGNLIEGFVHELKGKAEGQEQEIQDKIEEGKA